MKFVDAAINGPMMSDSERVALRKGLFSGSEDAINYWINAGSDAWMRAASAATYTSLVMMLTSEVAAINQDRDASDGSA